MNANLNFLTAASTNTKPVAGSSGTSVVDPTLSKPMKGMEFAGLMRDLMPQSERQDIAAQATDESKVQATSGLQTLNLGNQFAVITAASPLPDTDSLAQFARAQGLSESAVQALFGDIASSSMGLKMPGALQEDAILQATDPALLNTTGFGFANFSANSLSMTIATPASSALAGSTLTVASSADATPLPSLATLSWLQAHPGSEVISDKVEQSLWTQAPHLQVGANVNAGLILNPSIALATATTPTGQPKASEVNALLQTAGASGILQTLNTFSTAPSNALGNVNSATELPEELGPLDAMRMRMVPTWENMTRKLSQLNGSNQSAAWGELTANLYNSRAKGGEGKEVVLDLGADDPELMSALDTMADKQSNTSLVSLDSGRNTASTGTLGAAATSAALANPELTERAVQIKDMADKLGKAMAERLQDQMESGEWKLQLKLNPAHLGKIDVELDMTTGGLDAVFKSDNPLTRELIAQGMPKLKDSLAQSGMTVANVWVNSENQKGSGGNSTPRQNSGSEASVNAPVAEIKAAESRIKELRSSDAWDTLA